MLIIFLTGNVCFSSWAEVEEWQVTAQGPTMSILTFSQSQRAPLSVQLLGVFEFGSLHLPGWCIKLLKFLPYYYY